MKIAIILDSSARPKYQQIAEQIRSAILARQVLSGELLPPVRELAHQLSVGRMTVSRAYSELEQLGFIKSTIGSGSVVCEPSGAEFGRPILKSSEERGPFSSYEHTVSKSGIRSLATAVPDPMLFFGGELVTYLAELRDCDPWTFYSGETLGHAELGSAIQSIMSEKDCSVPLSQIVVTSGLENSIQAAILTLTKPEEIIFVQDPLHMNKPAELAQFIGRRIVNIRSEFEGFDLNSLETAIKRAKPRMFILSGGITTPFGKRLDEKQIQLMLELAEKYDFYLLELDTLGWLYFEGAKPKTLYQCDKFDRVIYCGSIDHMLTAGIRTGWICCPSDIVFRLEKYLLMSQVSGSPFIQLALGKYIQAGKLDAHCKRTLPEYRLRRDTMHRVISSSFPHECKWSRPEGGLTFWIQMPAQINTRILAQKAFGNGVMFCPGFRVSNQRDADQYLRLGFGLLKTEAIQHAVKKIGDLISLSLN